MSHFGGHTTLKGKIGPPVEKIKAVRAAGNTETTLAD